MAESYDDYDYQGSHPVTNWTRGRYADRVRRGAAYLRGQANRQPPPSQHVQQSKSRRQYQQKRNEEFRIKQGTITMNHLAKELQQKFMVGVKK